MQSQARSLANLWLTKLTWFAVAAAVSVMLVYLPAGLVLRPELSEAERPRGVVTAPSRQVIGGLLQGMPAQGPSTEAAVIQVPRERLGEPFRILPEEASRQVQPWIWSAEAYWQKVQAYARGLAAGSLAVTRMTAAGPKSEPILPRVGAAWKQSFFLFGAALLGGGGIGLLVGSLSLGSRLFRPLTLGVAVGSLAVPDFFLVLLGQFATIWTYKHFGFRLWSVLGTPDSERFWLLPVLALSIAPLGYAARLTAAAVDEVLREDYIRTARAKGVHEMRVLLFHALRNALPRILAGLPSVINLTLSSLIVVELLTSFGGLGSLIVMQAGLTDPMVAATAALVFCGWFTLVDGLAQTVRILSNPLLREVRG